MIGDALAAALPMMRAQAESLMTDTCAVDRLTSSWDEEQQTTVTSWAPVVAGSICHFSESSAAVRSLLTDEVVTQRSPSVRLPSSVSGVRPDDRVTIVTTGPTSDETHAGAVVWVSHVPSDSHPVERVIECRWVK